MFQQNLQELTSDRLTQEKTISFNLTQVGLPVFIGEDNVTRISMYKDAYALAFSKEHSVGAWALVGTVPVTRKCLQSDKVLHNSEGDPLRQLYKNIEQANHLACDLLSSRGYHSMKLKLKLRKAIASPPVTLPNSKDMINALINAKYHR